MKKSKFQHLIVGFAAVTAIALAASCASAPAKDSGSSAAPAPAAESGRKVNGGVPQFIKDALKSAPEDALIGIGTAKMATLSMSRTIASSRARAEISRQMNTMVRDMIRDYTAASEVDPDAALSFQEVMTVSLSESTLQGAGVIAEDMDDAGNYWVVVQLGKTQTVAEINQAQSAAKLKVPAAASFDAEARMDAAFDKMTSEEVGYSDKDAAPATSDAQ